MYHETNLVLSDTDPTYVASASDTSITGDIIAKLPGLNIYGPEAQIRAWLQAGLEALSDGTVRWDANGARITPLRPTPVLSPARTLREIMAGMVAEDAAEGRPDAS